MTSTHDGEFRPLPFLSNPHVQTVLGHVLAWTRDRVPTTTQTLTLPDGDALVLHDCTPPAWQPHDPLVLLVHGLGGCHRSNLLRRVMNRMLAHGMRVVRVDLRGAGAGMALARRRYNAACSADVAAALHHLHAQHPNAPLGLVGFSLGGNIVLKLAGELPDAPIPNLRAVVSVNPPVDLLACWDMISRLPFYDAWYVRMLRTQAIEHARHFPDLPALSFPTRMSLWQFDDLYTAPRGGFKGVEDYYRRASSEPYIERIAIPTFLLTARDDPFVAVEPIDAITNRAVEVQVVPHGGHLGFLGSDGGGGLRWMEARLTDWIRRKMLQ